MTEENVVENEEVVAEETVEGESNGEPSGVEQRAREMGWKPKDNFEGNEDDFIDAAEFVRRKPLFDKIDHVGKELKETRKALKALQEHHTKVKENEFKAAVNYLKQQKKAALEAGDAELLIEIDERIADAKVQQNAQQAQIAQAAQAPHPGFVAWVQKNEWYQSEPELRMMADQIGTSYASSNPNLDPEEVLSYVEKRIKKVFPDHFKNPNKNRPSAVEGSSSAPSRSSKQDNFELTDDERRVMNTFIRQGIMTKEQYIADLKKVRG